MTRQACRCETLFEFASISFTFLYNLRRLGGGSSCFGGLERAWELLNLDFRRFWGIVLGPGISTSALLKLSLGGAIVSLLFIVGALVLESGNSSSGCSSVKLSIVAGGDNGVSTWWDGSFTALLCMGFPVLSDTPIPAFGVANSRIFDIAFLGIGCGILGLYLACRCGMVVSEEYVWSIIWVFQHIMHTI